VRLVDANVLLAAVNTADARHDLARTWLDGALGQREGVGFAWTVLLAFLRLVTRPGLFPSPLPVEDALAQVREWTAAPPVVVLNPTPRHLDLLAGLLSEIGTGGNLVGDAHLAALALEHGATVITFDADFGRFAGVRWQHPA
jgi:uncharacterized protein